MVEWYYAQGSQQHGPITGQELRMMAQRGDLGPGDLVWKDGMAEWTPASRVHGLFGERSSSDGTPPRPATGGRMPAARPSGARRCHEIDFEIHGDDMQVVEVELDPGETVIAEAGAMNYMEDGIIFEAKMGDGSQPDKGFFGKVFDGAKRMITGESLFLTHFTHQGQGKRRVAFAGPYPGKIVALDLTHYGGSITCQKDAFLAAALGTEVGIVFNRRLGRGFFGGEGFILQKLTGDGMAFIHAGGHIVRRELNGEVLRVDTGCLVAFTDGVNYDIERAGNLKSMVFGGEGLFLATLRGQGIVWLQTLPFSRLADRIIAHAPSQGGKSKGEGSVLGGLGDLFGDR